MQAVEQNTLTLENIYKILLDFDKFFDKMEETDKRKLLESMVSEVPFILRRNVRKEEAR